MSAFKTAGDKLQADRAGSWAERRVIMRTILKAAAFTTAEQFVSQCETLLNDRAKMMQLMSDDKDARLGRNKFNTVIGLDGDAV